MTQLTEREAVDKQTRRGLSDLRSGKSSGSSHCWEGWLSDQAPRMCETAAVGRVDMIVVAVVVVRSKARSGRTLAKIPRFVTRALRYHFSRVGRVSPVRFSFPQTGFELDS